MNKSISIYDEPWVYYYEVFKNAKIKVNFQKRLTLALWVKKQLKPTNYVSSLLRDVSFANYLAGLISKITCKPVELFVEGQYLIASTSLEYNAGFSGTKTKNRSFDRCIKTLRWLLRLSKSQTITVKEEGSNPSS